MAYSVNCLAKVRALNNNYWYLHAHNDKVEYGYCRDESCECNAIICDSWREGHFTLSGLNTFVSYPCTVFEEEGREVVMMMNSTNYFIVQNTECIGETCTWSIKTIGSQLMYNSGLAWDPWAVKMVTIDNVPHFFNEESIFHYSGGSWVPLDQSLQSTRYYPLVLSIPEEWLCYGNAMQVITTTTTSTTTTSNTTTTSTSTTTTFTSSTESSTSSVPSSTTTSSSSCPREGQCQAVDGRGVEWTGEFWSLTVKNCGEGMTGESFWWCDGCTGTFDTPEPDRSDCVQHWVEDVQDQVSQTLHSDRDQLDITDQ